MSWIRNVFTNWTEYDAPVGRKVAIGMRNAALRLRGKPCCGHPGEPGC
ncbi:MAG: hypothetical protein HY658_10250 [Actinobacteria bacterium]|nr:hypothetical protein [Actinomycetota bacterium]